MKLKQVDLNDVVVQEKNIQFKTRFKFLLSHNGIRENKLHTLLAPTHAGKSTIVRSMITDVMTMNPDKRILIWLSEESADDFKQELKKCLPSSMNTKNIFVFSDIDYNEQMSEMDNKKIMCSIENNLFHYDIDLMFIDNITTSKIYNDCTIKEQSKYSTWLKNLTKECTVFCIAHTNTNDFNNRLISENDIRGSKTIVNLSEFLYIMQPININDTLVQYIFIKKHRGQDVGGKFYRLIYDKHLYAFKEDLNVEFKVIAEMFQQRNKLGK